MTFSLLILAFLVTFISTTSNNELVYASYDSIHDLNRQEIEVVNNLVKSLPNNDSAYYLLGQVYNQHGDTASAIKNWKKCLSLNAKHSDAYINLGLSAAQAGDFQKAVGFYHQAIDIKPNQANSHNYLALALISLGRFSSAIDELTTSIEISPNSSKSVYELGRAYFLAERYQEAKIRYELAIALNPVYTPAYYGLATTCSRLGLLDQSKAHLELFGRLKAEDLKNQVNQIRDFDDLALVRKKAANTFSQAATIYSVAGKMGQAKNCWEKATKLDTSNQPARLQLMLLYKTEGDIEQAIEICYELTQIEPGSVEHHLNFGLLLIKLDQFTLAESAFQKAIAIEPKLAAGYRELAELYLHTNHNLAEAMNLAETAVRLESKAPNYYILAWACEANHELHQALDALDQAMKLIPGDEKYQRMYDFIKQKISTP